MNDIVEDNADCALNSVADHQLAPLCSLKSPLVNTPVIMAVKPLLFR